MFHGRYLAFVVWFVPGLVAPLALCGLLAACNATGYVEEAAAVQVRDGGTGPEAESPGETPGRAPGADAGHDGFADLDGSARRMRPMAAPDGGEASVPSPADPPEPPPPTASTPGTPSGGCGLASPSSGLLSLSMVVRGQTRGYSLRLPSGYDPSRAYPLIFAFHGISGGSNRFMMESAAADDAIHVLPEAPVRDCGGRNGRCWLSSPDGDDVAFFDALLAEVGARYCVDLGRVIATGFSAGGDFVTALACHRRAVLAAVAPVGGASHHVDFAACLDALPTVVAAGEFDPFYWYARNPAEQDGRALRVFLAETLTKNGCGAPVSPLAGIGGCSTADDCRSGHMVAVCEGAGLGHAVPPMSAEAIWRLVASL